MGRCLTLLGMMAFTVGVVALASAVQEVARPARLPQEPQASPVPAPRLPVIAARGYHAPLSLN
jgi:hypothetical protein